MVIGGQRLFERQAVGRGHGGLEEHDARLRHVGLEAALQRDRDARRAAASPAVSMLRFSVSPAARYIVGCTMTGTPAALISSSDEVGLGRAVEHDSYVELLGERAARRRCPARGAP